MFKKQIQFTLAILLIFNDFARAVPTSPAHDFKNFLAQRVQRRERHAQPPRRNAPPSSGGASRNERRPIQPPRQSPPINQPTPIRRTPIVTPPRRETTPERRVPTPIVQPPTRRQPIVQPPSKGRQPTPIVQPPTRSPDRRTPIRRTPPFSRPPVFNPPIGGRYFRRPFPKQPPYRERRIIRERFYSRIPRYDWNGRVFRGVLLRRHPSFGIIIGNPYISNHLLGFYNARHRFIVNRNYWYEYRGTRYSCLWDGVHFTVFISVGSEYYPVRYHNSIWEWYDPVWNRTCYWHNGYWWWTHPSTRVVYIYRNNQYYRYQETPSSVIVEPDLERPQRPSDEVQAPVESEGKTFYDRLGTRMVQIIGPTSHAHLYSYPDAQYLADLGTQVQNISFSYRPDQSMYREHLALIIVERMIDGKTETEFFDSEGRSINSPSTIREIRVGIESDRKASESKKIKGVRQSQNKSSEPDNTFKIFN